MRSVYRHFCCFFLFLICLSTAGSAEDRDRQTAPATASGTGVSGALINTGALEFGAANDGRLAYDPDAGGYQGLYYPAGQRWGSVVYAAGPLITGVVDGGLRSARGYYGSEFAPGTIGADGLPVGPDHPDTRLFVFSRGEAVDPAAEALGCPPRVLGDRMIFCVYNDAHPELRSSGEPLGLEVRQTIWAHGPGGGPDSYDPLEHSVFLHYRITNRSAEAIDSCFFGIFCDADNGDASDDMTGCDTSGVFGFIFNGDPYDNCYGVTPPAVALEIFAGPAAASPGDTAFSLADGLLADQRNFPMTAYTPSLKNGPWREMNDPNTTHEYHLFLQCLKNDGSPYIDPVTGLQSSFPFSGDPVTGSGWLFDDYPLVNPYDARFGVSCGPVSLQPGESAEYFAGLSLGRGSGNLNSIEAMRHHERAAQHLYDRRFQAPEPPIVPVLQAAELDEEIVLYWDSGADSYRSCGYEHEGYNVWYGESIDGPWEKIEVFDRQNGITAIEDWYYSDVYERLIQTDVQRGRDSGLRYSLRLTRDPGTGGGLVNGRSCFFAVTSYAYNPDGLPRTLESAPVRIEAVPQRPLQGTEYQAGYGSAVPAEHISGASDGRVNVSVVDPSRVTGHAYEVRFTQADTGVTWDLIDITAGRTVLAGQTKQGTYSGSDDTGFAAADGLEVRVYNPRPSFHRMQCTANAAGPLVPPESAAVPYRDFPVPRERHSSGRITNAQQTGAGHWAIHSEPQGAFSRFYWFMERTFARTGGVTHGDDTLPELLAGHDFEIRFTGRGRAFDFRTGTVIDVPFELWDTGSDRTSLDDDMQLVPYLDDRDGNGRFNLMYDSADTAAAPGWADHVCDYGENDPWTDPLYWMAPANGGPGSAGYERAMTALAADPAPAPAWDAAPGSAPGDYDLWAVMHRIVLVNIDAGSTARAEADSGYNQLLPETGTVFQLLSTRSNGEDDVYAFSTAECAPVTSNTLARQQLDDINVYPNPFFAASGYVSGSRDQHVTFSNLPGADCIIRIFTLNGNLVRTIRHDNGTPFERWDLENSHGFPVASGMYLAAVQTGYGRRVLKLGVISSHHFLPAGQ